MFIYYDFFIKMDINSVTSSPLHNLFYQWFGSHVLYFYLAQLASFFYASVLLAQQTHHQRQHWYQELDINLSPIWAWKQTTPRLSTKHETLTSESKHWKTIWSLGTELYQLTTQYQLGSDTMKRAGRKTKLRLQTKETNT